MNYNKIAAQSPEIIIWSDASRVKLTRNAKTGSIGISLETFKSRCGAETYTLLTKVKPECSISNPLVLGVGYRIKSMNGHDITQFETTLEIKNLMLHLDCRTVEMVVVKPVGLRQPFKNTHSRSVSDGLTLNLPSMSTGSVVSESRGWDPQRPTSALHNGRCKCSENRPPSTFHLHSVSAGAGASAMESIPLREMCTSQGVTGDCDEETRLAATQGLSRHLLELLAVKYPQKIRYEMPFKVVLNKNHKRRLGFSYKIKLNEMRHQRECGNEDYVYDYLVESITAPPAEGKLQIGDCIQSVNHEPMTQRSDERLKKLIREGGDEVVLFVQRPEALCSGLSQGELDAMLAGINPEMCRNNHSRTSNGNDVEPVDSVVMETSDATSASCSGVRYCRRRAAVTMTRHTVHGDMHVKPLLRRHRRSQSDSSVMFYEQVFQDACCLEDAQVLPSALGDGEADITGGYLSHALPQTLLSEKDLQELLSGVMESLASVTLKKVPLVRLLVLSEKGDMTAVHTLLRSALFPPDTHGNGSDPPSTVLCVQSDGQVNSQDTQAVRELIASGVTVSDVILAKYITQHLRCQLTGWRRLQLVAASLVALSVNLCGASAAVIGRLLYQPLHKDSDIVEVTLECLCPTAHMWPAARFTQHAIYIITFDLDLYLMQFEQLQQVQRQLNVIRSYAGQSALVILMTDRRDNSIESVTQVAKELHERCSVYDDLLCYNLATALPLFVREEDDWAGRDFHVLEKTLFQLVGQQQLFVPVSYPLAAVTMRKVLLHHQRVSPLKTMSLSHLQLLLYEIFGHSSGLLRDTLLSLHQSGILSCPGGVSERSSHDPILDIFVLTDLSVVEACVQLLCEPCPDCKDAWHQLLKTSFTDHSFLLGRLHTRYMDGREIAAFLQLYHTVFLAQHQCLLPYHLQRWCGGGGGAPPGTGTGSQHTLYIDFHGFLPVYLGCHMACGLAALLGTDSVRVDSEDSATVSTPRVNFSLEMSPTHALCKVLVT